jgi:hypothetical protein
MPWVSAGTTAEHRSKRLVLVALPGVARSPTCHVRTGVRTARAFRASGGNRHCATMRVWLDDASSYAPGRLRTPLLFGDSVRRGQHGGQHRAD